MPDLEQETSNLTNDRNNEGGMATAGIKRVPAILLVDTSWSMTENGKIDSLNEGIKTIIKLLREDNNSKDCVELSIIEFNENINVVTEFTPVSQIEPVKLTAQGGTSMGQGILTAIEKIRERRREYAALGMHCYMPWIFMITDGAPTDNIDEARDRIREEENRSGYGKLRFMAIGVDNYNEEVLKSLTPRIIKVKDSDLRTICGWIADNMKEVSASAATGEAPKMSKPPINAEIVDNDIPDYWNN